jgi:hypothetical protein
LVPIRPTRLAGLTGINDGFVALVACKFPNGLFIPDKEVDVGEANPGIDMLIGMDLIGAGDFHISNNGGKTLFSFVIPPLPTPINLELEAERLNQ